MAAAVGILLGAYLSFAIGFYWIMQPSVAANYGVAAYRPPPKTVIRDADAPWVPPGPSEAYSLPATAKPDPALTRNEPMAEPKPTKKQERAPARQTRPLRQQQNPFWGNAFSPSAGSRRWF